MKKAILVIMDGVGISPKTRGNAVFSAIKPNLDKLLAKYPNTVLEASGKAVGLPQNQMGNSEVGHLNIGAGRIVYTGLSIINNELENGQFYTNDAFAKAIAHVKSNNSKLHVMGLVSHGGVHSSFEHIVGLIKLAHKNNIKSIIHIFSDGRDVAPESIINDLNELTPILKENNAVIGTISGRYYAMDRDKN
jgi:2,3-bisphosphoglycerate-independent phosphoglycerate mutase